MSANPDTRRAPPKRSDTEFRVVVPSSFGAAIREFRQRGGLSQETLAERAGVFRSYLSALEAGASTEAVVRIVRLLDALDLEVVIRPRSPE